MTVEARSTTTTSARTKDRELIMERTFDAPREVAFRAFSDCDLLSRWWGPKGWTLPVCEMDFRPGGTWRYCMRGPTGDDACGKAIYREIVEPERIVYTDWFTDADGTVIEGMPETLMTFEFAEQDGKTKVTNRARFASVEDLQKVVDMGMVEGMIETWDRLEAQLTRA